MDEAERHYEADTEAGQILIDMEGDDGNWSIYISVIEDEENRRVLIYSYFPVRIQEANRSKVAEQITRINYDLAIGNFGLSMSDGLVFFKTAIELADGQMTSDMFEQMLGLNAYMTNSYYADILSVGYGGEMKVKAPVTPIPDGALLQ